MNSKKTLPWLILFWLACIVNLIGHLFEIELLSIVSKPGLMILVGIYFYNSVEKNTRSKFIRTTLFALLFSWLGDVLLIFENLFLFGLAAFLIAHLFYAFTYSNAVVKVMDNRVTFVRRLFWSIALILFGIAFLYLMEPNLQEMFIPVVIYSMVIVFMGVMAVQRNGRTSIASYGLTLLGALLFLTSDSILALNKFAGPIEYSSVFIMLTYVLAQWLIIEGIIKHFQFLQSTTESV